MDSTILDSNTFDHPLQLALGDSAVGCVCDDLSRGPLDDGVVRAETWHACYRAFGDWEYDLADTFAPWGELSRWCICLPCRARPGGLNPNALDED